MNDIIKMIELLSKTKLFLNDENYIDFNIIPRTKGHQLWEEIHDLLSKNNNELIKIWHHSIESKQEK